MDESALGTVAELLPLRIGRRDMWLQSKYEQESHSFKFPFQPQSFPHDHISQRVSLFMSVLGTRSYGAAITPRRGSSNAMGSPPLCTVAPKFIPWATELFGDALPYRHIHAQVSHQALQSCVFLFQQTQPLRRPRRILGLRSQSRIHFHFVVR